MTVRAYWEDERRRRSVPEALGEDTRGFRP